MEKEIIVLIVPKGISEKDLYDLVKSVAESHDFDIKKRGITIKKKNPVVKTEQELFGEIVEAALLQYKERRKVVANLTPSWTNLPRLEQLKLVFSAEPELLTKLIDAGITGEKGNRDTLLEIISKQGLWELPVYINALRKS